jgi:hypothetical protein
VWEGSVKYPGRVTFPHITFPHITF